MFELFWKCDSWRFLFIAFKSASRSFYIVFLEVYFFTTLIENKIHLMRDENFSRFLSFLSFLSLSLFPYGRKLLRGVDFQHFLTLSFCSYTLKLRCTIICCTIILYHTVPFLSLACGDSWPPFVHQKPNP